MVLPIYAYGHPILKKVAAPFDKDFKGLESLLDNMWETMYHAKGVGLAAPQIGHSIRLFLVDTIQIQKEGEENLGIKKAFINAEILEEHGEFWSYEEGCLSIPKINGDVERTTHVKIKYYDSDFNEYIEEYDGMSARVIQHEYDHIEGHLFVEKLNPLKRRLIQKKLENIKKGRITADYTLRYS